MKLSPDYRARLALDVWAECAGGWSDQERAKAVREDFAAVRHLLGVWEAVQEGLEWNPDARALGEEMAVLASDVYAYTTLWEWAATTPYAGGTLKLINRPENLPRARRRAYSILYELGEVDADQRPRLGGLGKAGALRVFYRREKESRRNKSVKGQQQG